MNAKVLRIGIAPREALRKYTIDIASGRRKRSPDDPDVWFTSIESLSQILSTKNKLLLEIIRKSKPASLTELAALSGRKKSNLSRTLKQMAAYKLVSMLPADGGKKMPVVNYDKITFDYDLAA